MGWLSAGGVSEAEVADWGDTLKVSTSVGAAERLLGVRLHRFVRAGGEGAGEGGAAESIIRAAASTAVALPPPIESVVSLVLGVTFRSIDSHSPSSAAHRHPLRRPIGAIPSSSADSAVPVVVPATIAATYDLPCHNASDCLPFSSPAAAVALIEFGGLFFLPSDLVQFGLQMGLGNVSTVARAHLMQPGQYPSNEGQKDIRHGGGGVSNG